MKQVVIENPVLNSPFREPTRHFRFTDEGITNEIEDGRRISSSNAPCALKSTKPPGRAFTVPKAVHRFAGNRQNRRQGHQPLRRRGAQGVRCIIAGFLQ